MRSRHALRVEAHSTRILLRGSRQQLFLLEDIFFRGRGRKRGGFARGAATGIETSSDIAWTNRELVNWFQNQFALPTSA